LPPNTKKLRAGLKAAGLSDPAIDAAWPEWWTEEAGETASGRAELRFALARRLGLSPTALLGESVEFLWSNEARFKHLSAKDAEHKAVLASFGMTIGRLLIHATPRPSRLTGVAARELRDAILQSNEYVELKTLVAACWALGVPLIHLRVFPLAAKSMHAMVVRFEDRFAILLGRDARYPAPIAFTLAHEMGHVALGHIEGSMAIVDMDEDLQGTDNQEKEADQYALEALTGTPDPIIDSNVDRYSARSLARAVLTVGPQHRIEPGALALCFAYRKGNWPVAMAALSHVYERSTEVWREINKVADFEIDWDRIGDEAGSYLRRVMGASG
jgi:hypothetical protein